MTGARQARGLDLMLAVCEQAARQGLRVGLYGGEPVVTADVRRELAARLPRLEVSYCWSPPFRDLSAAEDDDACKAIVAARTQLLFVSLGCPKQERWMLAHRDRLPCVMLGVGAAFDMLTGRVGVAPQWMQRAGLEWVYRFFQEPRRLWRRYARHNGRFVAFVLAQRLGLATGRMARGRKPGRLRPRRPRRYLGAAAQVPTTGPGAVPSRPFRPWAAPRVRAPRRRQKPCGRGAPQGAPGSTSGRRHRCHSETAKAAQQHRVARDHDHHRALCPGR